VFAQELSLPLETNVYLKERNTYGLLNGLKYTTAQEKYPELMKLFDAQQFIPGSERYDDFIDRVTLLLEWIKQTADIGTTVYVTQGYLMTTIIEEFLGKVRKNITYGSYFVCEIVGNKLVFKEWKYMNSDNNTESQAKARKKFKN
jgi:broad specificity phosphatase PhoE